MLTLPGDAQGTDATTWFDFTPPPVPATESLLDLRYLNERQAGDHGRILARDGRLVQRDTGRPVRFWAVNGPPHALQGDALKACARRLAQYGVNLVRVHGAVFDERTGELRPERVRHLAEVLEAMKAEGIYTLFSIYFPLWFKPQPGLSWLEGYDGTKHPFAALLFNPEFQARHQEWWRAVLTTPRSNGQPLATDPALFGVEIQNEDSFFFWTFSEANVPDPQLRRLEHQFGDWLVRRHGSLGQAFAAWGGARLKRDVEAEGRVAFRPLWDLFTHKTARDRDTAAFLLETQRGFYQRTTRFFRELGFEGLVVPSNWSTANAEIFGPLEKYSYTAGDLSDRHGYFGCHHRGPNAEWSIREGHTYFDRSALRFDPEEPGKPAQFNHPAMDIEYQGQPTMLSESTWNRPNRYRGEAPLFFATYAALQDTDALVHFALDGPTWDVKPNYFMQPWTLMAPTQIAQFPAAALVYRLGLVREAPVLASVDLNLNDLTGLKGTPLPQDAAFDELRLKDVPEGRAVQPGQRIDPLIHFAGRTRVRFTNGPSAVSLEALAPWIDRTQRRVRSATGEVELDYGRGILTVNAPGVQAASGALGGAGEIVLRDVRIESPLDPIHIVLVALDGRTIAASRRLLLQVMSEERPTGWQTTRQEALNRIEKIGTNPWQVRQLAGRVRLTRPDAAAVKVTALDLSGRRAREQGQGDRIDLLPETVYYLLEK